MRPRALFITWSVRHGRSRDLAAALGAEAAWVCIPKRRRRWHAPFRYIAATGITAKILVSRRPRAIFVMQPPLPLAIVALVYGRLARVPVALDAHTGAVLKMRTGSPRRSLTALSRFATATIVTNSQLAAPLQAQGLRCVTLHDPPMPVAAGGSHAATSDEFVVVAPLSWASDEPIEAIIEAARRVPDVRFVATGRAPVAMHERTDLPTNLVLIGFLEEPDFDLLMAGAGAVLALTTRDATMQRAGYEAMALGRPVIASDTRVLREFFADAALYANTGEQIATAVREVQAHLDELVAAMAKRRSETTEDFARGLADLRAAMGLT